MRITRIVMGVVLGVSILAAACSTSSEGSGGESEAAAAESPETPGCSASATVEPGVAQQSLDYGGVARAYQLSVPDSYDAASPAPLLLDLHGLTSTIEEQSLFSDYPEAAGDRGYVVVTPQGLPTELPVGGVTITATYWNVAPEVDTVDPELVAQFEAADDIGFISALLDELEADLCIDEDRLYVSGMSNGAAMSVTLACVLDGRFAAIVPVAGVNITTSCDAEQPTSVIAFHGDADVLAPYEGGSIAGVDLGSPSVEERMSELASLAGCDAEPTVENPHADIETRTWTGCTEGVDLQLYTVLTGGHSWPGVTSYADTDELLAAAVSRGEEFGGFDITTIAGHQTENVIATEAILDFFDAHPRPG